MREQSLATSRPYVVVAPFLELGNPMFYLRISNQGKTAATNLRLTIDKSFYKFGEGSENRNLATFTVFNQPIDSFPPGAEITFTLALSFEVFKGNAENPKLPHTFSVTAEYEFESQKVKEANRVDLRPYLNADVPQDAYIRKLEEISKSLKTIAEYSKKAP